MLFLTHQRNITFLKQPGIDTRTANSKSEIQIDTLKAGLKFVLFHRMRLRLAGQSPRDSKFHETLRK